MLTNRKNIAKYNGTNSIISHIIKVLFPSEGFLLRELQRCTITLVLMFKTIKN